MKSIFLNGLIKEDVYVKQPSGIECVDYLNHVYNLDKALYGLKQAPRTWYGRLSSFLQGKGYTRGEVDQTLFTKIINLDILIV